MAVNSGSKDKSLEALDFIINVLKEHEQTLDKSIEELANVAEQIGDTADELKGKVDGIEERINNLEKEVTNLMAKELNAPKEALPTTVKAQEPQTQATLAGLPSVVQSGPFVVLRCKQWEDFQVLAMHVATLSFSYKEAEKIFQAEALRGNQIIVYVGALPNFSKVLKAWLSKRLDVSEQNILEGVLDRPK
jgi:seryl-tRNA synthetase